LRRAAAVDVEVSMFVLTVSGGGTAIGAPDPLSVNRFTDDVRWPTLLLAHQGNSQP